MIAFLTSEAGLSLIGLVVGYFFRYNAERNAAINARLVARDDSMDRASKRDGGTWMRRAILGILAFVIVSVIFAGFVNVPVVVENEVTKGILFWKKAVTEFVTVNGVLFPSEVRKAFLMLCAYYLGQGTK